MSRGTETPACHEVMQCGRHVMFRQMAGVGDERNVVCKTRVKERLPAAAHAYKLNHPLVKLHHPLIKLHHPLIKLHHPLIKLHHPLIRLHHPLIRIVRLHHPLINLHQPLKIHKLIRFYHKGKLLYSVNHSFDLNTFLKT